MMKFIKIFLRVFIFPFLYGALVSGIFVLLSWILLWAVKMLSSILFGATLQWSADDVTLAWVGILAPVLCIVGGVLNLVVVSVNGFKMPVKDWESPSLLHCPLDSSTRLRWLADVIPCPFVTRVSIGDIFIFAGLLMLVGLIVFT